MLLRSTESTAQTAVMKRDMDLVRKILIEMEEWPPYPGNRRIEIEGYTDEQITHHIGLMTQAGLIHALNASSFDGEAWLPQSITWEGHEFLDAARSDSVWNKAKDLAKRNAGTLTLEGLKIALGVVVKAAIAGQ